MRESCSASVTSRCWAPSCRLRSIRRRSASPAEITRSRDARTSARLVLGLRMQLLILQRDGGRAAHRLNQLRVVVERPVIDQRGDHLTIALDRRHRPVTVGRQGNRPVLGVDKGATARNRVGDHQRRVTQRPGQRGPQLGGVHRPHPPEQLDQAAPRKPGAQEPGEERHRDHDDREGEDPEDGLRQSDTDKTRGSAPP